MGTRMIMAKGHRGSLVFSIVCGSHWLVCCNKELIIHQGVCQVWSHLLEQANLETQSSTATSGGRKMMNLKAGKNSFI